MNANAKPDAAIFGFASIALEHVVPRPDICPDDRRRPDLSDRSAALEGAMGSDPHPTLGNGCI
jgi:hypothetical protein